MSKPKTKKSKTKTAAKKLGKGLSALLGDSAVAATLTESHSPDGITTLSSSPSAVPEAGASSWPRHGETMVAVHHISPGPWQPRRHFGDSELDALATSLKTRGLVQPLLVRSDGAGGYQIIAGERRWRAAQRAGLHELPVLVRDVDDRAAAELSLIENIQRHDLSAIEEAGGYARLMEEYGYTQDAVSELVGKSRSHIANTLRLMSLPDAVQELILTGRLTAGQARPLIGLTDPTDLARKIAEANMSAREVEIMVGSNRDGEGGRKRKSGSASGKDPDLAVLEQGLSARLGLGVKLHFNEKSGKGRIVIEFSSFDQFDAVVEKLK